MLFFQDVSIDDYVFDLTYLNITILRYILIKIFKKLLD